MLRMIVDTCLRPVARVPVQGALWLPADLRGLDDDHVSRIPSI